MVAIKRFSSSNWEVRDECFKATLSKSDLKELKSQGPL